MTLFRLKLCSPKRELDEHFFTVCRYVERNVLKANLVSSAEQWRWSSLYRWLHGSAADEDLLSAWPIPRKRGWLNHVNEPLAEFEYKTLQRCVWSVGARSETMPGKSNNSASKVRSLPKRRPRLPERWSLTAFGWCRRPDVRSRW